MEPLGLVESQLNTESGEFLIFSHSAKSRLTVLTVFVTYFIVFGLFTNFLTQKMSELRNTPEFIAAAQSVWMTWAVYATMVLGWLFALIVLAYLAYATIDFWGLQVCLSRHQLMVRNTLSGDFFARRMGVGSLNMADVTELKGGRLTTTVTAGEQRVFFSPVDRLDLLIAGIMEYAPQARLEI